MPPANESIQQAKSGPPSFFPPQGSAPPSFAAPEPQNATERFGTAQRLSKELEDAKTKIVQQESALKELKEKLVQEALTAKHYVRTYTRQHAEQEKEIAALKEQDKASKEELAKLKIQLAAFQEKRMAQFSAHNAGLVEKLKKSVQQPIEAPPDAPQEDQRQLIRDLKLQLLHAQEQVRKLMRIESQFVQQECAGSLHAESRLLARIDALEGQNAQLRDLVSEKQSEIDELKLAARSKPVKPAKK